MTLKIFKGLFAIVALVQRFAGSSAKPAHEHGIVGVTMRALNNIVCKNFVAARGVKRWRNAIFF